MAEDKKTKGDEGKSGPKKRVYVGKIPESMPMDVGKTYTGTYRGFHTIALQDQNSGEDKDVRVYLFRDEKGEKFTILGRTGLDLAFDEAAEREGGNDRMIGLMVEVSRGPDSKLNRGRTFGNYTIAVWEDR